ncbi:ABC transporter permease [Microaceticoccus formicicus]|uniref:ABC transporter permease n=1 Tax=Microaceticoccus formicicus TaxID=3118105 RepID=UPI003CD02967|nr:ABC transporter permease [Peptoniphilaceae bacterium AMB_02]
MNSIAKKWNNRQKMLLNIGVSIVFISLIILLSFLIPEKLLSTDVKSKNVLPSMTHLFGTDWLGRDMFARSIYGLKLSMSIGLLTSVVSVAIALTLGSISALGGKFLDGIVSWIIDLFIGMPHLVFMVLLSFMVGGGKKGIILGVGLTHWPSLARLIRSKIMQVKSENYIQISRQMGAGRFEIFKEHILPHLLPQAIVGFILLFPHVILHESALTFLGFGLSPQTPAMGIILSEGMGYISTGSWWLILLPAILLIMLVKCFGVIGEKLELLLNPVKSHE